MLVIDSGDVAAAAKKLKIAPNEENPKWVCLYWLTDEKFGVSEKDSVKFEDGVDSVFKFGTEVSAKYGRHWYAAVVVFASEQENADKTLMKLAKKLDSIQQVKIKKATPTAKRTVKRKIQDDFTASPPRAVNQKKRGMGSTSTSSKGHPNADVDLSISDDDEFDGPTPPPSPHSQTTKAASSCKPKRQKKTQSNNSKKREWRMVKVLTVVWLTKLGKRLKSRKSSGKCKD
ncbi:uncharacterized protein [Ptychodera flava]|uniref:uncharacterized protein n=1 Tax=Ptychodera flava TaxID=63121 RepID=UPI00396AAFAE